VEEALESEHLAPKQAKKLRADLEMLRRVRADQMTMADLILLRSPRPLE